MMLSDFKRCQSEIEQSISNCLKHNRSMKKKIGFLTFILFVVLSSIACVKSQEVFRFMHQEFSYDNQICITFRIPAAQSYSIVSEKFGAPDIAEKRCDTRHNLAEYYLKQYQSYTGEFIDLEEFLKEIYIIWLSYKSNPWEPRFDASEVWEKATKEQKQKRGRQIYKHLDMLISQLPIIDRNGLI